MPSIRGYCGLVLERRIERCANVPQLLGFDIELHPENTVECLRCMSACASLQILANTSSIRSLVRLFVLSFDSSFVRSFVCSFVRSFGYWFVCLFILLIHA
uniref:Uncharacterized protein n=1 Tax=Physcomitrium patens TaxID=3218 RepID=A0A2K1IWY6_PHYPA|nr:hypothetical protein PHYPA_023597 [Physcomitrium patens]